MLTLDEFLEKTIPDAAMRTAVQETLNALTSSSAVTRQFVLNLRSECRVEALVWKEVVDEIQHASPNPAHIRARLTTVFRRHTREGVVLAQPWPACFGRVVERPKMALFLKNNDNAFSDEDADAFLDDLVDKPVSYARGRLKDTLLAENPRYSLWATFNRANPAANPFEAMPPSAPHLTNRLGLPSRGYDLFKLAYSLPAGVTPRFPTVADAYVGDDWPLLYRASTHADTCGWTMPRTSQAKPCPEVVHEAITGATLEAPVQIAKPLSRPRRP